MEKKEVGMILVDTSVWIDFFAGRMLPHVKKLEHLLEHGENVCISGTILTEVLQGIRADKDYHKTTEYFSYLIFLPATKNTYIQAAAIYRSLRKKGVTIRNAIDTLIASIAIENGVPLLHNDRDFEQIERHSKLKVIRMDKSIL